MRLDARRHAGLWTEAERAAEKCATCGNPRWAACHCMGLDTPAMREEFVGFHEFVPSGEFFPRGTIGGGR